MDKYYCKMKDKHINLWSRCMYYDRHNTRKVEKSLKNNNHGRRN